MKVAVWDTYVHRNDKDGIMHFDILVPEDQQDAAAIRKYGEEYLNDKTFTTGHINTDKCVFCHVEQVPQHIEEEINRYGFAIVELSNCE
ncbi:MAG: DUF2024 family protein [Crocinitomicaceae bacterium]